MAQAVRKVWLEPEEQTEAHAPRLTPRQRRRKRPLSMCLRHPLVGCLLLGTLAGIILYTYGNARIAQCDVQRQRLQQELQTINRECVALRLECERLAAQPRLIELAREEGLELPTADRVHYVHVVEPVSPVAMAQAPARDAGWMERSSRQLVASLHQAWQRLGRGPGEPAYAQE